MLLGTLRGVAGRACAIGMLSVSEPGTVLDCKNESLTGRKVGRLPFQRDAAEVVVGMFSLVRSLSSGESRISDAHM
jgi:hypothetical protein